MLIRNLLNPSCFFYLLTRCLEASSRALYLLCRLSLSAFSSFQPLSYCPERCLILIKMSFNFRHSLRAFPHITGSIGKRWSLLRLFVAVSGDFGLKDVTGCSCCLRPRRALPCLKFWMRGSSPKSRWLFYRAVCAPRLFH